MQSKKAFTVIGALALTGATAVAAMAVNMGVLGSAGASKAGTFAPTTRPAAVAAPATARPTTTKRVPPAAPRTSLLPPITVVVTEPESAAQLASVPSASGGQAPVQTQAPVQAPVVVAQPVASVSDTVLATTQNVPAPGATSTLATVLPGLATTTSTTVGSPYEVEDGESDEMTEAQKKAAEAAAEAAKKAAEAEKEAAESEDDD